jgi:bifunctional non-homologous end joining protein LigD
MILHGRRLRGKWALVRLKPKEGERNTNWLLLKERDEFARDEEGVSHYDTSIRTGRTMAEIEAGAGEQFASNPFDVVSVQLAKLVRTVPEGDDWVFELKYDGYRIVAFVEGNRARLITRNGHDYTHRFPAVSAALEDFAAGRAMVLDGEMVITDPEGKTDFQALQSYIKNPQGKTPTYIVFDLLALDGADLRGKPLIERKETLRALMEKAPSTLHFSRHVEGSGRQCFEIACQSGMEGIVGKRKSSVYSGSRSGDWVKLKCDRRQELVIGGYTRTEKKAEGVSALLLGVYEKGAFVYCGRAGTGISEADGREIEERAGPLRTDAPPFINPPKIRKGEEVTWLRPELVAEVKFAEWTEENLLRQASFKGLRTDKNPGEIVRERTEMPKDMPIAADSVEEMENAPGAGAAVLAPKADDTGGAPMASPPEGLGAEKAPRASSAATGGEKLVIEGVAISNPQKVIFTDPAVTKGDVVRYYAAVAERMLPYIEKRILSIVRCPKGVANACFYKKHPGTSSPGVITVPVTNSGGETEEYFYIDSVTGLVSEAQMGTLEFHTWGSRVETLEQPDMMVFDLDPDEGMDIEHVRRGVLDLKGILDELSLVSYLKTSGGKGYHVVVPLRPSVPWDVFYDFSRRVAEVMEQKWPDRYTSNMRKAKRAGRIFIDWVRNGRGATSIAPYSIRARQGAKVSMPISWEELGTVAPDGVSMAQALRRAAEGDPWQGFFQQNQLLR